MKSVAITLTSTLLFAALVTRAQQPTQPQLKVDSSNRTLTVTATDSVTVEPDLAILHIGFVTQPQDAKSAYADGSRASNAIIAALKQAGVEETAIRSESQYLDRDYTTKQFKYVLHQQWTVKVPPARAAEILDVAINAGATSSGQIDWTVKDEKALEDRSPRQGRLARQGKCRSARQRNGRSPRLPDLRQQPGFLAAVSEAHDGHDAMRSAEAPPQPLAIEPHQVSREATVYAVFAIE